MHYLLIIALFLLTSSDLSAQKKVTYIDEFGKELKRKQVENYNLVRGNGNVFFVKYGKIEGNITDSLKDKIIAFLSEKSNQIIPSNHILILSSNISEGNCNIQNLRAYDDYRAKINQLQNTTYFEVTSQKNTQFTGQIWDEELLVFNNFFSYYKWDVDAINKCGGTLLIFPDNKFIRLEGDSNDLDVFDILK